MDHKRSEFSALTRFYIDWSFAAPPTFSPGSLRLSVHKLLDTIWTTIYQLIYLCYDTGEDFMTQFERNKTALLEIIQKSEKELGDLK